MRVRHMMCVFLMMIALLFGCASPHYTVTKPAEEEIDMAMVHIVMHLLFMEESEIMTAEEFFAKIPDAQKLPKHCRDHFSEEGYDLIKRYANNRYGSEDPDAVKEAIFTTAAYVSIYAMLNFGDGKPPLTKEEAVLFEEATGQSPGMRFFQCLADIHNNLQERH